MALIPEGLGENLGFPPLITSYICIYNYNTLITCTYIFIYNIILYLYLYIVYIIMM